MMTNSKSEPMLGERFEMALGMMFRLHRSQVRKGGTVPYISHLMSVAALVLEDGGDEDEAIAALLHDAMEDQGLTADELRSKFGDRVCEIVEGCTETVGLSAGLSAGLPKPPWKDRKVLHLAKMENASDSVRRVTRADKLHNVRSLLADYERFGPGLWERFGGGREGTIWYYREMVSRLDGGDRWSKSGQRPSGMMRSLVVCVEQLGQLI